MRDSIKRRPVLVFFALTIIWIWVSTPVLFAVMQVDSREDIAVQHVILVFLLNSPSLFGILMALLVDGREGLRSLFARAVRYRVKPAWYAAALLVPAAVYGLNFAIQGLFGVATGPIDVADKLAFSIPTALMACLLEEFGWRGFAQPRLQRHYSVLLSTLVVGLGWGLWHLPINYLGMGQYGTMAIPLLILGLLSNIALSVLLAWVHNNAQQSMLLVLLRHFAITFSVTFFGVPGSATALGELRGALVSTAIQAFVAIVIVAAGGLGTRWLATETRPA